MYIIVIVYCLMDDYSYSTMDIFSNHSTSFHPCSNDVTSIPPSPLQEPKKASGMTSQKSAAIPQQPSSPSSTPKTPRKPPSETVIPTEPHTANGSVPPSPRQFRKDSSTPPRPPPVVKTPRETPRHDDSDRIEDLSDPRPSPSSLSDLSASPPSSPDTTHHGLPQKESPSVVGRIPDMVSATEDSHHDHRPPSARSSISQVKGGCMNCFFGLTLIYTLSSLSP